MGLTQSTITLQIQSLERDLKTQLFDRSKKRIKLNKNGQMFYEMVSCHLNGIDSLYDQFANKKNYPQDQISIAVNYAAISHLLPPFIKKFQDQNPNVTISIKNITFEDALKRLQEDEVDFILYPNINPSAEFYSRICFAYDPILIMHKNHPLTKKKDIKLQDISKYNVVRIDKRLISLPLFEKMFEELKFKTNIDFENGSWEMVKNFVRAGIGLGFVSELYFTKDDEDLVAKKLNNYFPRMEYKLVVKNGKHLSDIAQKFIAILTEER